jgi:hypothetical protein
MSSSGQISRCVWGGEGVWGGGLQHADHVANDGVAFSSLSLAYDMCLKHFGETKKSCSSNVEVWKASRCVFWGEGGCGGGGCISGGITTCVAWEQCLKHFGESKQSCSSDVEFRADIKVWPFWGGGIRLWMPVADTLIMIGCRS